MKGLFVYRKNEEIVKGTLHFLKESQKDLSLTGLIFDKDNKYSIEYFDEQINLDSESLTLNKVLNIRKTIKQHRFDCAFIPCSSDEISKKNQDITIEKNCHGSKPVKINNMFGELIEMHEKIAWMLRSHLE